MKKEQGITMISLAVTIIVLIILSGVSINLILGQDGLITKAKEAKQNIELAYQEEAEMLNELYSQTFGESTGSDSNDAIEKLVEFKKAVASAITDMGVTTSEQADADTMASNIRSISNNADASSISYNNSNSGLQATTVQSAVDELDSEISDLNSSLSAIGSSIGKDTATKIDDNTYSSTFTVSEDGYYLILGRVRHYAGSVEGISYVSMFHIDKTYVNADPASGCNIAPYEWGNIQQFEYLTAGSHSFYIRLANTGASLTCRYQVIRIK